LLLVLVSVQSSTRPSLLLVPSIVQSSTIWYILQWSGSQILCYVKCMFVLYKKILSTLYIIIWLPFCSNTLYLQILISSRSQ
jgi:hypothetical protein